MNKLLYIALLSSLVFSQNEPPVLIPIGYQIIDEDTQIVIALSATDSDGDILTFTAVTDNENIEVSLSNNILTLMPSENYYGMALVTVTVSDGFLTDSEIFTLTVIPVNDAPMLLPVEDQIIYEGTQIDITLSAYDIDGDELVFSAASDTEDITVSVNESVLTLTPAENFIGSAVISVTANDGSTGSNMETFTLTVLPVNDLSTWHISTTGSDETGDGSAENPFATIQHGIEMAIDGDTVLVHPGTYDEPIDFLGKSIVLGSLYILEENESYIDETILSNFVNISLVPDSELNGFTFQDIYLNSDDGPQAIIYIKDASPIIINNRFDNFYLFQGVESAVIYCENSNSLIMNNVFTNGSVGNGYVLGGYILSKNSNLTIKNNQIENGYVGFAEPSGYIVSVNSENIIESNIIINPSMGYCWVCAAISILDGSNCIIRNNLITQAYGDGYGAVVASESQYVSHNNTFVSNSVGYANLSSDGIVSNDIIYGSSNTVYIDENSSIEISFSNIEGGWEGEGNIDSDPLFVAPDSGDYHLQANSPCIDAGDPDLDGDGEDYNTDTHDQDPDGTRMDMGSYYYDQEGEPPPESFVWYVSTTGSDSNNGSEEYPFATIQHGIDVSSDGDSVLVSSGTYIENINYEGKNIVVKGDHNQTTFINGNQIASVVVFDGVEITTASVLSDFTVINGNSYNGGGVYMYRSDPTLTNVTITQNNAIFGGGMYLENFAEPVLNNVRIHENIASNDGGGIYLKDADNVNIISLIVSDNYANDDGGGIFIDNYGSNNVKNTVITGNACGSQGGGVFITGWNYPTFTNVIFANNSSQTQGGGVYASYYCDPTFINVTLYGNEASLGGGIYFYTDRVIVIKNSIFWYDYPQSIYIQNIDELHISYSDIEDGVNGIDGNTTGLNYLEGNINTDPLFVDTENGDFSLQPSSPCIDAGDPSSPLDPDSTIADMGAFYYHQGDGELIGIAIDYQSNWNLVGLPIEVEDASYSNLFPESLEGTLYSFNGGYITESYLTPGNGYWLRFNNAGSTTITGTTINELTISLSEGWNIVSGLSEDVSIYSVSDPDSIIVPGTLYGFVGGYVETDVLVPGNGYWVRAYQDGEVIITGGATARVTPQDFNLKGKANTLTINGTELYFGIELSAREKLSYSLPPKPPSGALDVRFKGDTRIATDKAEIEVMSTYQTLIISYDVIFDAGEHMNWVLTSESGNEYTLESIGEITVPTEDIYTLERKAIIPIAYTLHQNYPNPFNPITSLRYDLPEQAQVTLTIYDLVGREVTQLVNTKQEAGYRSVQWDATDSFGKPVSAGVYLYQIRSGEFVQTKKMVLLK